MNTLLKGLEKIAASADIPMLVAGDFNSVPGSAAHTLLLKRGVDPNHPVCGSYGQPTCIALLFPFVVKSTTPFDE